ncbi:MAG TPA: hypothetical protein DCX53_00695 [Anaerolineae bacterium]|nr:hypothetical protein [Anaerolineae bacterium]
METTFLWMLLLVVPIILIIISVVIFLRNRKKGLGSVISRIVGMILGGIPIAAAFAGMMISAPYTFPESHLFQGFFLGFGILILAVGNAHSERVQFSDKKKAYQLKGTHWALVNIIPAVVVEYLLIQIGVSFVPAILIAVAVGQWFLLKQIFPVSPWWLLWALFASFGYYTNLAESQTVGFYIGGILMAIFQYFLLKPHNSEGALLFAGASLLSWLFLGSLFDYILGPTSNDIYSEFYIPLDILALSYYGQVIIWGSVLVGLVAKWTLIPQAETQTLSETQTRTDK